MRTEYDSLMQNNTWTLVSRPKNQTVLPNKWVFKVKENHDGTIEKYKARLVARGDRQQEGIDYQEIFSPVARYDTIRTFLACCVEKGMYVHQMDVVSAYVQADLSDEIYMAQPEMFVNENPKVDVCKLNKPLYGLKQAGRKWYEKLDSYMTSVNLKKTATNPCVYVDADNNSDVIIIVYVDDLLIGSKSLGKIEEVKTSLKAKFKMKDLGEIKNILGIHVDRDKHTGEMRLSQRLYIENLLKRFDMENCNSTTTPLEPNEKFTNPNELETGEEALGTHGTSYRELIGSLIYLANATRPDISFAASALSRFCETPHNRYWKMAKRVLRYLRGTIDYAITYKKINSEVTAYVDSDWGGDVQDRRSCSGFVVKLANGPISWGTRKQKSVALSTMEAEYVALSELTKEVIYIRRLIHHMKLDSLVQGPTSVSCDNQSAIALCNNSVYHSRSKHIDIRYHFSREALENGDINVKYLSTDKMVADVFTKALAKTKHAECVRLLNLRN